MVLWPLPQPSTLKVASSILAKCKVLQKNYQISARNAITMERKVIRPVTVFLPARANAQLPERKSSTKMEAILEARRATARAVESPQAEPNGFRVHLLNHSDTLTCRIYQQILNARRAARAGSNRRYGGM